MTRRRPRRFWVYFNSHVRGPNKVWGVKWKGRYLEGRDVDIRVPTKGVYRGKTGPQPKAYLAGSASSVVRRRGVLVVRSAS